MKNIFKIFLAILVTATVWSCKKDEKRVILKGGTPPVLTSSITGNIPLSNDHQNDPAFKLSWTNPEYQFNTGISSLDVNYNILVDTTENFSNPEMKVLSVGTDLAKAFTQGEFNDILLNQLQLKTGTSHNIAIKVNAFLAGGAALLSSNALKLTATPYAIPPKVVPPAEGTLWLTGDATTSGYSNPLPSPYDVTQKFTQISTTLYELTVTMKGGGAYKLIQKQGEWSSQFHMITGGTWSNGDFEQKDSDPGFAGPAAAGSYKITVDFQRGKYTVVKL